MPAGVTVHDVLALPVVDLAIATLLAAYTMLSVYNSWRPRAFFDRFGHLSRFIPKYNFFAPEAAISSFRFAYRDKLTDGEYTEWRFLEEIPFRLTPVTFVWNPKRTTQKTLDIVAFWHLGDVNYHFEWDEGMRDLNEIEADPPHFSHEMLLELARSQPHHPDAEATQFLITQAVRSQETDRKMLRSRCYDVENEGAEDDG